MPSSAPKYTQLEESSVFDKPSREFLQCYLSIMGLVQHATGPSVAIAADSGRRASREVY